MAAIWKADVVPGEQGGKPVEKSTRVLTMEGVLLDDVKGEGYAFFPS